MDSEVSRSSTAETRAWNWRTWFLLGWGVLILLGGAFTLYTWLVSLITPSGARIGFMIAILWGFCLIWLAVLLEDFSLPLAIALAGAIGWIYTTFEVNVEAHVPGIVAGGCLLGGSIGGLIGSMVRKVNKASQSFSVMLTLFGSLFGFIIGHGAILVFSWLLWA